MDKRAEGITMGRMGIIRQGVLLLRCYDFLDVLDDFDR